MRTALVRTISPQFADALVQQPTPRRPVYADAVTQHAAYARALQDAGLTLRWLGEGETHIDGCFVEDQAVVCGNTALVTRCGAPRRRAEALSIARTLTDLDLDVHHMAGPASCDGGDVLTLGRYIFVGRSSRTNAEGVKALRQVFEPVGYSIVEVDVHDALHLKCHCTALADDAVLTVPGFIDKRVFDGIAEVLFASPAEAYAANVLRVGDTVLIADGYPGVRATVLERGLTPLALPMQELALADGSLTCLSILIS
ncbi:MAG: dimethylargininase [Kiritimatiellia bacterium]|jgi:dimethylargininase